MPRSKWALSLLLFVFPLLCTSYEGSNKYNFFPVCANYKNRAQNSASSTITIPAPRTSEIVYSNDGEPFSLPVKSDQELRCDKEDTQVRRLRLQFFGPEVFQTERRNFNGGLERGNEYPHQISYFTSVGMFYDNLTAAYYRTDGDYCIESYSDTDIELHLCPLDKIVTEEDYETPVIIPKCCALEEVLLYWKMSCVPLPEIRGITPWKPPVYQYKEGYSPQKPLTPQDNIRFKMARMSASCTLVPATVRWWNGAKVKHPRDPIERHEDHSHLVANPHKPPSSNEVDLLVLFSLVRQWQLYKTEAFCVDGFYVKDPATPEMTYTGTPENFVIYYCSDPSSDVPDNSHKDAASAVYTGISIAALVFLLATVLIYLALWKKHNLHGLIILCYCSATFFSYFFLAIAHIVRLQSDPSRLGLFHRGWFCYGVAIFAHWFYLKSYMWLTIMNVDLWLTFKVVRAIRNEGKDWKKFGAYSLIAWGVPTALMVIFITLDCVFREATTLVPVPDYAVTTCFVSPEFRGQYVYIPMAIFMGVNFILLGMTMWIFIQARRQASKTLAGGASNASRYSAALFGKLFIIMGGTSIVDFLTWYYNNKGDKPWIILVLECIAYMTPAFLFILFCFNDRILGLLREAYPNVTDKLNPVLRLFDGAKGRPGRSEASKQTQSTAMSSDDGNTEGTPLKQIDRKT